MTTLVCGTRSGQDGSTQDAILISAFATTNFSSEAANSQAPTLLRFPGLSAIPSGSTVTGAVLTVNVTSGAGGSGDMDVRKVLRAWVEAQATWNIWATSNNWTTAGAGSDGNDRSASNSCVIAYPGGFATGDINSTSNTQLIADVQAIVDGAANNGWLVLNAIGESIGLPAGADGVRPYLTVEYTAGGGSSETQIAWITA